MKAVNVVVVLGVAVLSMTGLSQEMRELAFHVAVPTEQAPVVDGALDDVCWQKADVHDAYYEYFKEAPKRIPKELRTESRLIYDAKGVYLGVRNMEPLVPKLHKSHIKNNDGGIWMDDSAEVYFDPAAAGVGYYKFVVNCIGKLDEAFRLDGANLDEDWTTVGVQAAAKIFDDRWEFELFVPFAALDNHAAAKPGDIWMFNHSRMRWAEREWTDFWCSSPMASGSSANRFGYLYFSDGKPVTPMKVLELLEQRQHTKWAIQIGEKTYRHDLDGTREMDETISEYMERRKRETALVNAQCETNIQKLAKDPSFRAEPLKLPLAGTYDLTPPKEYDGHNGWFRHNTVRGAYVTPHLVWAEKLIGKAPHPLYITPANGCWRDMIELDERFELDDPLYHPGGFGASGIYEDPVSLGTNIDKQRQIETLLGRNPDVIVVSQFKFSDIPVRYRYEILRRVRDEGVGLVYLHGSSDWRNLGLALTNDQAVARMLGQRLPICSVRGIRNVRPWALREGVFASEKFLMCTRFGKGRIAAFPLPRPPRWSPEWKAGFESRQAFAFGLIRWAQGIDPVAALDFGTDSDETAEVGANGVYGFGVETRAGGCDRVRWRVRNELNEEVLTGEQKLVAGTTRVFVDVVGLPSGVYFVDILPMLGDRTDMPAFRRFVKTSPVGKVMIGGTNQVFVAENRAPELRVQWERPLVTSGRVDWVIRSLPYKDVEMKGTGALKRGATGFALKGEAGPFATRMGLCDLTVYDDHGRAVTRAYRTLNFPNHRYPDYTMIMWGSPEREGIAELFAPQVVDWMGYDGFIEDTGPDTAPFNAWAVPPVCRVCIPGGTNGTSWTGWGIPFPPKNTKEMKDLWDKKYNSCYNLDDPEVMKLVDKAVRSRYGKSAKYVPLVWNLGDECWYTSNLGFGNETVTKFYADWLAKRWGSLGRLNAAYKGEYKSFAEVPHLTVEQALKVGNLPAWYDNVLFSAHYYARVMRKMSGILKSMDPLGRVGAEGSPAGDLEETVRDLEFWGPYRSLVTDEVLKSLKPGAIRGTWWGGYVRASRNGFPTDQWEYLLTGTINGDEWFCGYLGSSESCFAGDLQPAPYVKRQHDNHMQLKRGLASLLMRTPFRANSFIFYSNHASGALATRDDAYPGAGALNELIRFCYRNGYDVSFATPTTLGRLKGKKVLFLVGQSALSDAEVNAFQTFVKGGGKIYATCEPGVADNYLALRAKPPLKGLWTELRKDASDGELQAILAAAGDRPVEYLTGLEMRHTILRTRERRFASDAAKVFGASMKVTGFKTTADQVGSNVGFAFGQEGYVYETDRGYVGKCDRIEIAKLERPFKVFSVFEKEQTAPVFALDKAEIAAGERVTFETKALRPDSTYRLMVFGLDGQEIRNRAIIFSNDGKAKSYAVRFPYSDLPGSYKLVLRDIATGLETAVSVTICK